MPVPATPLPTNDPPALPPVSTSTQRTRSPAFSAAASVRPTAPTCGSVKITRGEAPPSERRRTLFAEDRVGREPRLVLPHVRQERATVDVTDGVEPVAPGHPERLVDAHVLARLETDGLETDVGGARRPSDRDEELVGFHGLALVELGPDGAVPRDRDDARLEPEVDASLAQRVGDLLGRERLLPLDEAVAAVHERHLRAERRPRLRHLDADDAAAEHEEARRHLFRGRRLDVRPGLRLAEARDVGDRRGAARRDDDRAPRSEHGGADDDPPLAVEPPVARATS